VGNRIRLALVAVLLVLSVVVDSVYYVVSAVTDGIFAALIVVVALPIIRNVWKS
jgi:hypothetical protein